MIEDDFTNAAQSDESTTDEQVDAEGGAGTGTTGGNQGTGLDGSTPLEGGIQGRLTVAGGKVESTRHEYDWQVHVDVDQPVQQENS